MRTLRVVFVFTCLLYNWAMCAHGFQDQAARPFSGIALTVQLAHSKPITCISATDDGELIATGSGDKTAIIWQRETGQELWRLDHGGVVTGVAFSRSKQYLLTVSIDSHLRWWNVRTGEQQLSIKTDNQLNSLAISPNGLFAITGEKGGTISVWDLKTNQLKYTLNHSDTVDQSKVFVSALAFSTNGNAFASATADVDSDVGGSIAHSVRIWDFQSGTETYRYNSNVPIKAIDFSSDGNSILIADAQGKIIVSTQTFSTIREIQVPWVGGATAKFSPDAGIIGAHPHDSRGSLMFWNSKTGERIQESDPRVNTPDHDVSAFTFLSGTNSVVLGYTRSGADMPEGGYHPRIYESPSIGWKAWAGQQQRITALTVSADLKWLAIGVDGDHVMLWDLAEGRPAPEYEGTLDGSLSSLHFTHGGSLIINRLHSASEIFAPNEQLLRSVGENNTTTLISSDGRLSAVAMEGKVFVSDITTSEVSQTSFGFGVPICFSHDDKLLAIRRGDSVEFVDSSTNLSLGSVSLAPHLKGGNVVIGPRNNLALFIPNDKAKLSNEDYFVGSAELRSIDNGSLVAEFFFTHGPEVKVPIAKLIGATEGFSCGTFHPLEPLIALGGTDHQISIYSASVNGAANSPLAVGNGHHGKITALAFSSDGKWLFSSAEDGLIGVWAFSQDHIKLVSMVLPSQVKWAVVDPTGRYDAADGGDIDSLHWTFQTEPVALVQLKERYYDPGLLSKLLGRNSQALREVETFESPELYPHVDLALPKNGGSKVQIDLKSRGGGYGKVVVWINGKELAADARGLSENLSAKPRGDQLSLVVDLAADPRVIPGVENRIEVAAFNKDGYLRSRLVEAIYTPPGDSPHTEPHVWAIIVGTSNYRDKSIDLHYAAEDAEDIAEAIRISAASMFTAERLHMTILSTTHLDSSPKWPSKKNILEAFRDAKAASPTDILVVYFSGHGVNYGGQDGDFYCLTSEARSAELSDPGVREHVALSGQELTELIKEIPALKQVLILDTCASGRLVEKLTEQRQVPASQIRALERVKDRTGMYVLAGCASDAVSYEASSYGQGLLTHSLLLGMRGASLRDERFVDVSSLFDFAADRVPQLAESLGGIQRPVVANPKGGASFDIGQLLDSEKLLVPLKSPLPMILRASFQHETEFEDTLQLAKVVNEQLRDISTRGRQSPLVYVDASELPTAYRIAGRYSIEADSVEVTIVLSTGTNRIRFSVKGKQSELEELAGNVIRETQAQLSKVLPSP